MEILNTDLQLQYTIKICANSWMNNMIMSKKKINVLAEKKNTSSIATFIYMYFVDVCQWSRHVP